MLPMIDAVGFVGTLWAALPVLDRRRAMSALGISGPAPPPQGWVSKDQPGGAKVLQTVWKPGGADSARHETR